MHPTVQMNRRTIYSNYESIKDPFTNVTSLTKVLAKIPLRSTLMYESQVIEAIDGHQTYLGIKGDAYLAKWINIPESVIYDPMHLIFIGTFKSLFNSFFDSKNHGKPYYLGWLIHL